MGKSLSRYLAGALLWCATFTPLGVAQGPPDAKAIERSLQQRSFQKVTTDSPHSYCGVCSLFRSLQALGKSVPFESLLREEYISSTRGSTLKDVQQAASDCGVLTKTLQAMTVRMLREVDHPAILHVRNTFGRGPYNHWVLYSGTEQGKARIYDGARDCSLTDFDELRAIWDGVAVVVSDVPIDVTRLWSVRALEISMLAGLVFCFVAGTRLVEKHLPIKRDRAPRLRSVRVLLGQALSISWVALGVALAVHALSPAEGLSHGRSIHRIQEAYFETFLPKVDAKVLASLARDETATVVDARRTDDFKAGHIPNARNIPPDVGATELDQLLKSIPASNHIAIYCGSKDCPYSGIVAQKVFQRGYTRISLYRGGWVEWAEREEPDPAPGRINTNSH
jgi:rhodanese-related sulfurtransferase